MKVDELIARLSRYPPSYDVVTSAGFIDKVEMKHAMKRGGDCPQVLIRTFSDAEIRAVKVAQYNALKKLQEENRDHDQVLPTEEI